MIKKHMLKDESTFDTLCGFSLSNWRTTRITKDVTCESCTKTEKFKIMQSAQDLVADCIDQSKQQHWRDLEMGTHHRYETRNKVECICDSCELYVNGYCVSENTTRIKFEQRDGNIFSCDQYKDKSIKEEKEEMKTYKQKIEIEIDVPVGMEVAGHEFIGDAYDKSSKDYSIFFKKKVKQGDELVGMLCGLSDLSLNEAKIKSNSFKHTGIIFNYNSRSEWPFITNGSTFKYAYPVSADKLKELLQAVER